LTIEESFSNLEKSIGYKKYQCHFTVFGVLQRGKYQVKINTHYLIKQTNGIINNYYYPHHQFILGNQGVFFHLLVPCSLKETPWESSLLKLVPEVKIQLFADWLTH